MELSVSDTLEAEKTFTIDDVINDLDFLTVLSNRRLDRENFPVYGKIPLVWSIDRITLVGKFATNSETLKNKFRLYGAVEPRDGGFAFIDEFGENIAFCGTAPFDKATGRIDFNPNKLSEKVGENLNNFIHYVLDDPHFSRVDVACDIVNAPDEAVRGYQVIDAVGEKIFLGKSKQLETHYWGSSASERQIRLYNKKVEQKAKKKILPDGVKTWWRLELQLRRGQTSDWTKQVYETLDKFVSPLSYGVEIKGTDRVMLDGLMSNPENWAALSPKTRTKYKRMIQEFNSHDILTRAMREVFDEDYTKIKNELEIWLVGMRVTQ